jgi:cation diffusion facilitator family transporter
MNAPAAENRFFLKRFAWFSIAAALATIALKLAAWLLTDSVGLLSDAMESGVNLVGGIMALAMLEVAARPADKEHAFGHSKAEYFSSGIEGTLILFAAIAIAYAAIQRLIHPKLLEKPGLGLAISVAASLINLFVALTILRAGKKHDSITLQANAHHLLTDVWTSAGVLVGVVMVVLSGWQWLDPGVAILVAANIVWTGVRIVRASILGLMDTALPPEELAKIHHVLEPHKQTGVQYHALCTRQSGSERFISLHVLVPGEWTVQRGHDLIERIEADIRGILTHATVFTHIEAKEDPAAWEDNPTKA